MLCDWSVKSKAKEKRSAACPMWLRVTGSVIQGLMTSRGTSPADDLLLTGFSCTSLDVAPRSSLGLTAGTRNRGHWGEFVTASSLLMMLGEAPGRAHTAGEKPSSSQGLGALLCLFGTSFNSNLFQPRFVILQENQLLLFFTSRAH